ncbi:hypothetical protein [Natrinema versiforme]|uniref:Lipoprotein n=1 Tax=Natrinema versiforme JCM 10478 TaxID=1227496 RepID=L9XS39_9EURY|nr:hypothetical protein [Natrinema versiforme]ELY64565.1 hypothetical protein C489_17469 [Natrinema versiforme JCM 10478]
MRRRDLLAGTTGAICGLAGCTGSTFERLQSERPAADDESADSSSGTGQDTGSEADESIVVGDPEEVPFPAAHPPHELEFRNEGETDRTVSVEITTDGGDGSEDDSRGDSDDGNDDRGDDALLERDLDIAAGETHHLVLVEPRSYTVTVITSSDGGASQSTVTDGVDRRPFDCTRSRTSISLSGTGVQTESTSASIPCPVPEVTDTSLEAGEGVCAGRTDRDGATVEFAGEAVIVDGEIGTPTPCHEVSLADATYDERRDVLTVPVAVGEQGAENCIDCLGVVDYEARIDLAGRYPDRVDVTHRNRDEEQRVTVAEYSAD